MMINRYLAQAPAPANSPAAPFALQTLVAAMLLSSAAATHAESVSVAASATKIEELIVVAHPLGADGVAQATTVLEGDALQRVLTANIGSTLATQAGIHNSSFGNAVGRPVVQGLAGPRIRVMQDRIDSLDVSVTSADHVVTVEPLIAERIEVLKGPSTLLYGTGAIGGVIDVQTHRIPKAAPEGGLGGISGAVETRFDDNTDGNSTTGMVRGGNDNVAWYLDATLKDGDPYEIPGFAESARQRAAEEAEGGEEEEEGEEEARDILPGSQFDYESYTGGLSILQDWGRVGFSVGRTEGEYGLPGGHGHEHEEGEEEEEEEEEAEGNPLLDMEQTRFDAELAVNDPFGPFTSLNVRLGVNDYEHKEIEPSGEVATNFENDAWELRAELVADGELWDQVIGIQHQDREFSALGEEAFVPPVDTVSTGVFWLGERSFDAFDLEAGVRLEQVSQDPSVGSDEDFTVWAASLGVVLPVGDNWRFSVLGSASTRAPVAEELYSNGPHLATNTFEIGDPELDEEGALNFSATLQGGGQRWNFSATAYVTDFSDYIYEEFTGEEEDDLPVIVWRQDDAVFYGLDIQGDVQLAAFEGGELRLRGLFDVVEAELDISGNDNVPRLPPMRYGVGLSGNWRGFEARIDYLRVEEVDDPSVGEFATDAYDDLGAQVNYRVPMGESTLLLFLRGDNLTDDEQRHHTSFIKDFAPAPGRSLQLGARLTF